MIARDSGGPAFPLAGYTNPGMTLRDWFAGQAMMMLADNKFDEPARGVAERCYILADAMLAERSAAP